MYNLVGVSNALASGVCREMGTKSKCVHTIRPSDGAALKKTDLGNRIRAVTIAEVSAEQTDWWEAE